MASCILSDYQLEALICEALPDLYALDKIDALAAETARLRSVTDLVLATIAAGAGKLGGTPAALGFARLLYEVAGGVEAAAWAAERCRG